MEKMKFENPKFHRGLNCTVRLGEKWKKRLNIGDKFLVDGMEKFWSMNVSKILVCKLEKLKENDIKFEHDPKCRTVRGLRKELIHVYPNNRIGNDIIVTVVYFNVEKLS